jgi:Ca2+-binding RTX toxin-like protein
LLGLLGTLMVAVLWPASAVAAPTNDDFANAQVITGATGSVSGSNVGATKELGEPDHAGNAGGHSIWYTWTAPADGKVAFTTAGSGFDTLLAVYTGAAVGALTLVAANDDDPSAGGSSTISFAVSNGVTYMIALDGFSGKVEVGVTSLDWTPSPANDNFADAQVLPSTSSGMATGAPDGATHEPGEPQLLVFNPAAIWYSWTAPADGTYKFDTVGSNFDTVMAIFAGTSLDALDLVRINDDDPDRGCCSSWVPIKETTAGTVYSIAVFPLEGFGDSLVLRWSPLILGTLDSDILVGTNGADEIRGMGSLDVLRGRGGNDALFGGSAADVVSGGDGNDLLIDRRGTDDLYGGAGNDVVNARDGHANDLVSGGGGTDTCRADAGDTRRRCP